MDALPQALREGRDRLPYPIACSLNRAAGANSHFDRLVYLLQAAESFVTLLGTQAVIEAAANGEGVKLLRGSGAKRTGLGIWLHAVDVLPRPEGRQALFPGLVVARHTDRWRVFHDALAVLADTRNRFAHPVSRRSEPIAAETVASLSTALTDALACADWMAHDTLVHVTDSYPAAHRCSVRLLMGHNSHPEQIELPGTLAKDRLLWLNPAPEPARWVALEPFFQVRHGAIYAYNRTERPDHAEMPGKAVYLRVDEPEADPWLEAVSGVDWLAERMASANAVEHGALALDDALRARLVSQDQVQDWAIPSTSSGDFHTVSISTAPPMETEVDIRVVAEEARRIAEAAPIPSPPRATLEPSPAPSSAGPTAPTPPPLSRRTLWAGLVLGAAIVLGVGFLTMGPNERSHGSECEKWSECGLAKGCINGACAPVTPVKFREAWVDYQRSRAQFAAGDPAYYEGYSDPIECWYAALEGRPRSHLVDRRKQFLGGDLRDDILEIKLRRAGRKLVVFEESHQIVGKKGVTRKLPRIVAMRPGPTRWRVVAEADPGDACDQWLQQQPTD